MKRAKTTTLILLSIAVLCLAPLACGPDDPGYTETQYPIVLCHGFLGFDSILNGVMDYWYGIEDALEQDGADVYVTVASPINSSENRGNQIIQQLEEIRAIKGDPNLKFNLIGHSQGGLDIRYIAGVRPDLVASLTAVATPHVGIDLFDLLGGGDAIPQNILDLFGSLIGDLWSLIAGNDNPNDAMAALAVFDPAGVAAFNSNPLYSSGLPATYCGEGEAVTQTSAGPRYNYSWTGSSPVTNPMDLVDPVFGLLSLLYDEPNDGLVEACGAHYGVVIRDDYIMNHLDEVNLLFGIVSPFEVDPKETFRTHANRLKNEGL